MLFVSSVLLYFVECFRLWQQDVIVKFQNAKVWSLLYMCIIISTKTIKWQVVHVCTWGSLASQIIVYSARPCGHTKRNRFAHRNHKRLKSSFFISWFKFQWISMNCKPVNQIRYMVFAIVQIFSLRAYLTKCFFFLILENRTNWPFTSNKRTPF